MRYLFAWLFIFLALPSIAMANGLLDSDFDGVPDRDEIDLYKTDFQKSDTDGDGFSDWVELNNGYSPLNPEPVKISENDFDKDGLSDKLELAFGSDLSLADTDGDGFSDGEEVYTGYNPLSTSTVKTEKRIDINVSLQRLFYFMDGVLVYSHPVSSGIFDSTPKGSFQIENKNPKAWSSYGLWMPYWMAITPDGKYGIHELPIWPNGYREGEDHLGTPVSHGCIRLGMDAAEKIYELTDVGAEVNIY